MKQTYGLGMKISTGKKAVAAQNKSNIHRGKGQNLTAVCNGVEKIVLQRFFSPRACG
jgi:hypothetical protein